MKILKIIFLIIYMQFYASSFAQDTTRAKCGTADFDTLYVDTLPWYGNNEFLVQFYDSVRTLYPNLNPDTTIYSSKLYGLDGVENTGIRIPVQFWVYNNPNIQFPDIYTRLQGVIDVLNFQFRYNTVPIRFYALCNQEYNVPIISSSALNDMTMSDAIALNSLHQTPAALNIHIVENLHTGVGIEYPFLPYAIFVIRSQSNYGYTLNPNDLLNYFAAAPTFTHETGHFLFLMHPFQFWKILCFREAVTRDPFCVWLCPGPTCGLPGLTITDCGFRGDFLCDTPADYDEGKYVDENCNYTGSKTDWRGDTYQPDQKNIMTYGNGEPGCSSHFTTMQKLLMIYAAFQKGGPLWISTPFNAFDIYEPDNNNFMAREIQFGIPNEQIHSFHMENSVSAICDEDWLKFEITGTDPSGIIEIATSEASTYLPNTELRLYDVALNQLAYDDDGNGNGFSKITAKALLPGWYYIKANCKSDFIPGEAKYKISVAECVPYNDCISGEVNSGIQLYAATNIFTAPCPSLTYVVSAGASVTIKAENEIILGQGFKAVAGSYFHAMIEQPVDCADDNTFKITNHSNTSNRPSDLNAETILVNNTNQKMNSDFTVSQSEIKIYPNPNNGNFQIDYVIGENETGILEIFDIYGKKQFNYVLEGGTNSFAINASILQEGIYFYRALLNNEIIAANKIVVIK